MKNFFLILAAFFCGGCSIFGFDFNEKAAEFSEKIDATKNQISAEIEKTKQKADEIKADVLSAKNEIEEKINEIQNAAEQISEAKKAIDAVLGDAENLGNLKTEDEIAAENLDETPADSNSAEK